MSIGERLDWTRTESVNVATTLADSGLLEYVEMGSDLVSMTAAGRRQLDRALDNDTSPGQQLAPPAPAGRPSGGGALISQHSITTAHAMVGQYTRGGTKT